MKCQDYQSRLLDGSRQSIDLVSSDLMQDHASGCPDCEEFQRLWGALKSLPQPEPPSGLSGRFHQRLMLEMLTKQPSHPFATSWWLPLSVAATLLLAVGAALGYSLQAGAGKLDPSMASFQRGTAADRMEAIAQVNHRTAGKGDIILALMDRVNSDPSSDVRLSAVEALYLFGTDPQLSQRIEKALPSQDRPEVQLALIDLMAALRQKRAVEALHRLVREDRLPLEARLRAEQRITQMNL